MGSEFLVKIRKIIVILLVLFVSILNTWIAFETLPVHAEESSDLPLTMVVTTDIDDSYNNQYGTITYTLQNNVDLNSYDVCAWYRNGKVFGTDTDTRTISFIWKRKSDNVISFSSSAVKVVSVNSTGTVVPKYGVGSTLQEITKDVSRYDDGTNKGFYPYYTFVSGNYPIAESYEAAENYLLTGDTSGIVNGGSDIDPHDDAYAFTGFSMSGKTATWTGTTERSYLLDMDVNEWVNYTYGFATSEDQEVSSFIDAEANYPTSDKKLALPWDEMEANKKEGEFIRQLNIIPCYGASGAGFYFGSPVCVYFDKNGKIESIVQNSVPTDGEVIGNNISLIGFRYDTSFHAEFVDVWSNAVNCSAFDLGGSQYLSLGVKALYYNGQSKDIDFVSLDRKNLVWDKTFDSFKTFNGSGIKQLFFTPYIKTGVNNPWNKGNSIVIDFDVNGNATSSFDTGDDGTVHLSDFKLTGVVWNKPMLAYGTITWTGTTANSDMSIVPDSDTLVVCSYPVYDSSLNESYETYDTVTIGKGSIRVYIDSLIDKYTNAGKTWNGEMWLTPCYKKGGVLYMGEPVIVNCTKGTVSDIEVDESTGTANQVDKTDENKSYADAILSSGNNFFSIVKGLIASMQQLPELIATLFSFLPGWVNALIAGSIFVIFVCRILGR